MNNSFGFFNMAGTIQQRRVKHFEDIKRHVVVDTSAVICSDKPYETAIKYPKYNSGDWVVVQVYDTKNKAIVGHNKWVKKLTADRLSKTLKDVSLCVIAKRKRR